VATIVWETPANRALGPDDFSRGFYQATWGIVGHDVVRAFNALWEMDFRSFHHLSEASMVLLHKTQTLEGLRDYRPISLIHSFGKLFAKGLALRLAPRITELVKINQTAFIRGRRIHDNLRTMQLDCRWLHARRYPIMLLKVNLVKAFDTVAWPFLLEVLEHVGFPRRWCDWVSAMLGTASMWVLVNDRLGWQICHARDLCQGDSLSPFCFIIVMEVLNAMITAADRRAVLTPLQGTAIKHHTSIYADDLVIFLVPTANDFSYIRQILDLFAGSSGLTTNQDKCTITSSRCSGDDVTTVQVVFPCRL
jgi:hypothetical protein